MTWFERYLIVITVI